MEKRLKCNSCGGTYQDTRSEGVPYYHVCPEQIVDTPEITDPTTHAITTPAKFKPTPNPRNENLKRHPDDPTKYVMISEGSGVTEVQ